jgi:hypothetical protein
VNFVFDDHSKWQQAEQAYAELKRKDSLCSEMMGSVTHADDKITIALQMADLVAHEARHKALADLGKSNGEDRVTFKNLDGSIYYRALVTEQGLLDGLSA